MENNKLYILLADDDKDDCLLFKEALNELPVSTALATVYNGEQLMKLLTSEGYKLPDVLFLDLNMPRKNGFACLAAIKKNEKLNQLPVIIFSTSFDKEKVKQVYNDAAHYYIRKPAEFSAVKDVINKVLTMIAANNMVLPLKENFVLKSDS